MLWALPGEEDLLGTLVAWGAIQPSIRVMILTSTRARPEGPVDLLSDYDVILAVSDAERFGRDDRWVSDYGAPMVRYSDTGELYGLTTYFHGVVYENGVKIDYTVWPLALLDRLAAEVALPDEFDASYTVLLDKDGRRSWLEPPSYGAYVPARPSAAAYRSLVEEFWFTSTYVAKSLWRTELLFARWCLDQELKLGVVRRLLE